MRAAVLLLVAVVLVPTTPTRSAAQNIERQLRENEALRDSIRRERNDLETQLQRLRGRMRDISTELQNLESQKTATARIVNELDRQMSQLTSQLDTITLDLLLAGDALAEKRAIQHRRIVEISKRGRLWTFQVLLGAENFSDLLSRYKYLVLVSRQDQALVSEVEALRDHIAGERERLAFVQHELTRTRDERGQELSRFQRLEGQRQRRLQQTRSTAQRASARIQELERAESELSGIIAALERRRREAVAAGRAPTPSSIVPGTRLPWPVEGRVLYGYGPSPTGPDNTVIRYQGIGIAVPEGTPVRAVASGEVVYVGPYRTYGLMVMVDHGGAYYTLYLYLSRISVAEGQTVAAGAVVGRSGGHASEEGPHVELQIREHVGGGQTIALDPMNWLERRTNRQ